MTMKYSVIFFTTLSVLVSSQANAQYNQQRGVVLGGLTGAAAGAIIGENSDEAGAGAAIGGVVGAIAGSVLGSAEDNRNRAHYAVQQQQAYAQRHYIATQAVGFQDVIAMTRSGVSQNVIITAIQQRGLQRRLEVADIVHLSQNGVGDHVIRAMQQVGGGEIVTTRPVVATQPVVVTRPAPTVVVRPSYGPRYYGHGHHYSARRGGPRYYR